MSIYKSYKKAKKVNKIKVGIIKLKTRKPNPKLEKDLKNVKFVDESKQELKCG